jgi:hypothetical protein
MSNAESKPGRELERRVADAYRAMGARKVEHDVELAGHQIDVYVELETLDRSLHRVAVEVKDYASPVGIRIVSGFWDIVDRLRRERLIDEGVVVSAAGFSRPARNAAKKYGIRLLEPADLDAMVAGVDATRPTTSPSPTIPTAPPTPRPAEGEEEDERPSPAEPVTSDRHDYDAFISYSHRNQEWVRGWLLPRLEEAGLRVLIDFRDFEPGAPVLTEMERAVLQSQKTLLVLTPDYLASEWAEFENILASTLDPAARRRRVIPLLLKPCELPLRIRTLTYLDFTQPSEVDFQLQRLIRAIGGKPMPPRVRDRRIDAAVPSRAEVGQHMDLLVQVRFPDSPLLGIKDWPTRQKPTSVEQESERVALKFPIDHRTGKLGSSCLQVRVVAPDFTIEGADQQSVEVPPDEYSKCIPFLLTARKAGCCRIKVEVRSVDGIYLGTISCETTVGGAVTVPSASVATLVVFVMVHQPESLKTPGRDELSVEEPLPAPTLPPTPPPGEPQQLSLVEKVKLSGQRVRGWLINVLQTQARQAIGGVVAMLVLMIAIGAWFWPDISAFLLPATPAATPPGNKVVIEMDGVLIDASEDRCQEVVCRSSPRIEAKVLDLTGVRLQPDDFSYDWRFDPPDPHNLDRLDSKIYAIIYSVPCDRDSQLITIEVLRNGKTLGVRGICFNIEMPP